MNRRYCAKHGATDSLFGIKKTPNSEHDYWCGHCMTEMFEQHGLEPTAYIVPDNWDDVPVIFIPEAQISWPVWKEFKKLIKWD